MPATLFTRANLITCAGSPPDALGFCPDSAVLIEDGLITWIGSANDRPPHDRAEIVDLSGRLLTPGLIDCHTHLVYGSDRANEYHQRLSGVPYEEIAAKGGGILSSVRATRSMSDSQLAMSARRRLQNWLQCGFTSIEIKTGYGLDLNSELAMIAAARRQADVIDVHTTLLTAHAVPPEFKGRADDFIDWIIAHVLPIANVDSVDAFCETIAFTPEQTARLFTAARAKGLPVRLHADQLSDSGGAALAAQFQALSADHLEYAATDGLEAMASAGTIAVLLPAAFYTLRQDIIPPIQAMRQAGVKMAVATDHNPGTAPIVNPLLALNMAVTLFGLTPEEALLGMTTHAAAALGLNDRGLIKVGMRADLAIFECERPIDLIYWLGNMTPAKRYRAGVLQVN